MKEIDKGKRSKKKYKEREKKEGKNDLQKNLPNVCVIENFSELQIEHMSPISIASHFFSLISTDLRKIVFYFAYDKKWFQFYFPMDTVHFLQLYSVF